MTKTLFNLQLSDVQMREAFAENMALEIGYYIKMQQQLDQFDPSVKFEENQQIFDEIQILQESVNKLDDFYQRYISDLQSSAQLPITVFHNSIPGDTPHSKREFIYTIFINFINQLQLNFFDPKSLTNIEKWYVFHFRRADACIEEDVKTGIIRDLKISILKLLLKPAGQDLIYRLHNEMKMSGRKLYLMKRKAETQCSGILPIVFGSSDFASEVDHFGLSKNAAYKDEKWEIQPGVCSDAILEYKMDENRGVSICCGQDRLLIMSLPHISLAHELIHVLHNFRGESLPRFLKYYAETKVKTLYPEEEYRTIETGDLSENIIRSEFNLPLRVLHHGGILPFGKIVQRDHPSLVLMIQDAVLLHQENNWKSSLKLRA